MVQVLMFLLSFIFWFQGAAEVGRVESARWHHRLLVYVVATEAERADLELALEAGKSGLAERDLVLVNLGEIELSKGDSLVLDEAEKALWRELWNVGTAETRFVLVGKDGGPKAFQRGELSLPLFFDLIDQMPMRRQEMRSRG